MFCRSLKRTTAPSRNSTRTEIRLQPASRNQRELSGAFASSGAPFAHVPHDALMRARALYTRVFASSHASRSELVEASAQKCAVTRSSELSARHTFAQSPKLASRSRRAVSISVRALLSSAFTSAEESLLLDVGCAACVDGAASAGGAGGSSPLLSMAGALAPAPAGADSSAGDAAGFSDAPPHAATAMASSTNALARAFDDLDFLAIFPCDSERTENMRRTLHSLLRKPARD